MDHKRKYTHRIRISECDEYKRDFYKIDEAKLRKL